VDARDKAWGGVKFREQFNGDHPSAKKLARQAKALDDDIVALQRATAKPYPYRFEIKRATTPAK
jgi:pyruvate dehydrogenase complex dehydrogenase (E1) component